jgi:cell division protein ZapA
LAQVTIKINGYSYNVGCEDGQESHLQAMATQIETRMDSIKALGGANGEARLLMLAALLMADELHDTKAELEALRSGATRTARPRGEAELGKRMNKLAQRAEQIAATLERP